METEEDEDAADETTAYADRQIQCCDCGAIFVFTAAEQDYRWSRGYTHEPKRCPSCRQSAKAKRYGSDPGGSKRTVFTIVCTECGKEDQVPFKPRSDRPVWCNECYWIWRDPSWFFDGEFSIVDTPHAWH